MTYALSWAATSLSKFLSALRQAYPRCIPSLTTGTSQKMVKDLLWTALRSHTAFVPKAFTLRAAHRMPASISRLPPFSRGERPCGPCPPHGRPRKTKQDRVYPSRESGPGNFRQRASRVLSVPAILHGCPCPTSRPSMLTLCPVLTSAKAPSRSPTPRTRPILFCAWKDHSSGAAVVARLILACAVL